MLALIFREPAAYFSNWNSDLIKWATDSRKCWAEFLESTFFRFLRFILFVMQKSPTMNRLSDCCPLSLILYNSSAYTLKQFYRISESRNQPEMPKHGFFPSNSQCELHSNRRSLLRRLHTDCQHENPNWRSQHRDGWRNQIWSSVRRVNHQNSRTFR